MKKDNKSKVIIIGNSPSILDHERGNTIDSYDVVIRINNCPVVGYERFIGKKINIWATTKNTIYHKNFYPPEYDNLDYIWHRTNSTKQQCLLPHRKIPSIVMYKNKFFNDNFKKYGEKFHKETSHEFCTGMLTILTSTIFFKHVDILGFKFYQTSGCKNNFNYSYYRQNQVDSDNKHFEDQNYRANLMTHFAGEKTANAKKQILDDLVSAGKINILD
mgnify:CR=1 FL=1|tara:strand:+ start:873 stop:1523 length:651 start_codon:yes stop_codon:yes gene_type:complete